MSFPKNVEDQAFAACARRCCICQKFCGRKMELHHIKQRAYDGEDSFENCIPLCFDCHADMGKADPKHPKGKHYSENTIEYVGSDIIYGVPFSVGAGIRIELTKRLSLGIGLNYSMLTSKFDGKYIKVSEGEIEPIWEKTKNIQHYIGVPLNIYYNIISQDFINFYAYAGGTVEKCVMNKYQIQTSPVINHTEKVKKVQMSANIGVGVEFLAGRHVGIYIDPSLRYYFRNGQPKSIRTAQPLMLGFEMGLRFRI